MNMENGTTVRGVFSRVIMRNIKTSYTVVEIKVSNTEKIVAAGAIIPVSIGTYVQIDGILVKGKYGTQIEKAVLTVISNSRESMIEYLSHIKGVGDVIAGSIADTIGDTLYKTPDNPFVRTTLERIKGVNQEKAIEIIQYVKDTKAERELFQYLTSHGGSYTTTLRIYKKWGQASKEKLFANPYQVGYDGGLSFATCDQIAMENGIAVYSSIRINAGIKQTLRMGAQMGHTYLTYAQVHNQCRNLLNAPDKGWNEAIGTSLITNALKTTSASMVVDEDRLYSKMMYKYETGCANNVKRLLSAARKGTANVADLCEFAQTKLGVEYAQEQQEAFGLLNKGGLTILTGGPGTGKTTVINGLLSAYEHMYPTNTIALCAPTGRASQRMKEATGREAVTLHRLLDYRPFGDDVTYKDSNNPIEADLIVLDEGSMLSIDLADILFSATKSGTMVLIVGDTAQLACVGAGNVLQDLIQCGEVPTVQLVKTYRQAETSLIVKNAKTINNGYAQMITGDDFSVVMGHEDDLPKLILDEVSKCGNSNDPFAVQVLTPARRKGECGATALNKQLQQLLNPTGAFMRYGDSIFRMGDKVMTIRNNYSVGYFNGDIGIICSVTDDSLIVQIDDTKVEMTKDLLDDLVLAYATTIHKSQGSEYATAIVVLPPEPRSMLQRNLLYTAITRAKKRCVIVTAPDCIGRAAKRCDANRRNTYLKERVCGS